MKTTRKPKVPLNQATRNRLLDEAVDDYAIHTLDSAGRIASWSAGAARLFGHDASEILGRDYACFHTRKDRDAGVPQQALRQADAVPHPFEEGRAPAKLRQVVVERAQGLARMPAGGVVDGHVQLEVVGVEAQLAQLLSGDQQVQRRLLVAEVVADHFGQVVRGEVAEGELLGALQVVEVAEAFDFLAADAGQQAPVEQDVVACRDAVAEFFEEGLQQRPQAFLAMMRQQPIEPGAVDQLGRGHAANEVHRLGGNLEVASPFAAPTCPEVFGMRLGGAPGPGIEPGRPIGGVLRQVVVMGGGQAQLLVEELAGGFEVLAGLVEQGVVQVADPGRRACTGGREGRRQAHVAFLVVGLRGRPGRPHIWVRVTPGEKGFTGRIGGAPGNLTAEKTNLGDTPASSRDKPRELRR